MSGFMGGGGGKSVLLESIGDSVTGIVIGEPEERESTDDDGNVRLFKNGKPRTVWVVPIATDLRDPEDPFDEGERTLWLKWKSLEAVQRAIRAAGRRDIEIGGTIILTLSGFGPRAKPSQNPPKLYSAQYSPPSNGFMSDETPPPAPAASPGLASAPSASVRGSILDRLAGQHGRNEAATAAARVHHAVGEPPF